jgi:hypothetical protein
MPGAVSNMSGGLVDPGMAGPEALSAETPAIAPAHAR